MTSKTIQIIINVFMTLICVVSLVLVCTEPTRDSQFGAWVLHEAVCIPVFAFSAGYLGRHLGDKPEKV
jgi:cytochrome bd-type quinol oxidase subunit 1